MINQADDFFDLEDFAEVVKLNGKNIYAIYDQPRAEIDTGFAVTVGVSPQITCTASDLEKSKAVQHSTVVVRKKEYTIKEIINDGTGVVVITLLEK